MDPVEISYKLEGYNKAKEWLEKALKKTPADFSDKEKADFFNEIFSHARSQLERLTDGKWEGTKTDAVLVRLLFGGIWNHHAKFLVGRIQHWSLPNIGDE